MNRLQNVRRPHKALYVDCSLFSAAATNNFFWVKRGKRIRAICVLRDLNSGACKVSGKMWFVYVCVRFNGNDRLDRRLCTNTNGVACVYKSAVFIFLYTVRKWRKNYINRIERTLHIQADCVRDTHIHTLARSHMHKDNNACWGGVQLIWPQRKHHENLYVMADETFFHPIRPKWATIMHVCNGDCITAASTHRCDMTGPIRLPLPYI